MTVDDVESVFRLDPLVGPDPAHSVDEERQRAVGPTNTGRVGFVVFSIRSKPEGLFLRPISTRDRNAKEDRPMTVTANGRRFPKLLTDEQAEEFVETADLSTYDFSDLKPVQFEFSSKDARVNMRLPVDLLNAVKATAARKGMPYQRFIRQALEQALRAG